MLPVDNHVARTGRLAAALCALAVSAGMILAQSASTSSVGMTAPAGMGATSAPAAASASTPASAPSTRPAAAATATSTPTVTGTRPAPTTSTSPTSSPTTSPADARELQARRTWAWRAACTDAALNFIKPLDELTTTHGLKLSDLLNTPAAQDALLTYLAGAIPDDRPAVLSGGGGVSSQLHAGELSAVLQTIANRYATGGEFRAATIAKMPGLDDLRLTGSASAGRALLIETIPTQGADYLGRTDVRTREYWRTLGVKARSEAETAARQDALARLGRQIKDFPVGDLTLTQFLSKYDPAGADYAACLHGAVQTGAAYYPDLPVAEVQLQVTPRTVYASLKSWVHAHKAALGQLTEVEQCIVKASDEPIRQTGIGACQAKTLAGPAGGRSVDDLQKALADNPTSIPAKEALAEALLARNELDKSLALWREIRAAQPANARSATMVNCLSALGLIQTAPAWAGDTLLVTGTAKPAKDGNVRTMIAAAALDAQVGLLTKLRELKMARDTTVGDLAKDDPKFQAAMLTLVQSARPVGKDPVQPDGSAAITLELPLQPLWRFLVYW
jgi:hypothetical protein